VTHPLIFNVPSFGILLFRYFVLGFVVNGTGKGGHLWIPLLVLPVPVVICKQLWREHCSEVSQMQRTPIMPWNRPWYEPSPHDRIAHACSVVHNWFRCPIWRLFLRLFRRWERQRPTCQFHCRAVGLT
jgi:hypothetical protein